MSSGHVHGNPYLETIRKRDHHTQSGPAVPVQTKRERPWNMD
jgi:hypothetical protein